MWKIVQKNQARRAIHHTEHLKAQNFTKHPLEGPICTKKAGFEKKIDTGENSINA